MDNALESFWYLVIAKANTLNRTQNKMEKNDYDYRY
jgi:hypothetical protein